MGFPKALLRLGSGRTLIQETVRKLARLSDDVIVVANDDLFAVYGARMEPDIYPGAAALGGIYSALAAARHDRVVVVGCDMPFLSTAVLADLITIEADAVVPRINGYPEPLHAVYGRACLEPIRWRIEAGQLRAIGFHSEVRVHYVDGLDPATFRNVNTPELLREAAREGIEPPTPSLGRMRSIH